LEIIQVTTLEMGEYMMTYIKIVTILLIITIAQGCTSDQVNEPPPEAPVENEDTNLNNESKNENNVNPPYHFTNFDLEVDYGVNESYEVSYENEADGMEVDIEDRLNGQSLNGDAAFKQVESKFKELSFDQNTPDQEVISEILNVFELDENYSKFELEVKFEDGTEKKYDQTK
jgi:hypothetical protein